MTFVFSAADRRLFKTAHEILGGPAGEDLESRLAEGVFGGRDRGADRQFSPDTWGRIDEIFLRRAGSNELALIRDCLEAGEPGAAGERPSAIVLRSLGESLFGQKPSGLDPQLEAGLHRLGRAMADLDACVLRRITVHLPGAWRRGAQAAWLRLSREQDCRAAAPHLRGRLALGGHV
jgi:hypothetical protein